MGSVHGWGTKILHAMQQAEKKKRIKKENPVKFKPPEELQTVTVFGVKAFTEEIQAKWDHMVGLIQCNLLRKWD